MGIMNRLYSFDPLIKQADESIGRPGPIDDYWYGDAGGASQTGVSVTPDTAMRASAVQACVRVLAETVAQLPLKVYETQPDGGKAEARNHPIFSLLHDQPNAWQTSFEFRETLQGHLALRGNAYAELIPGARGFVDQLIPLNPDKVKVEQLPNKRLIYTVYEDHRARKLTQDEVLHIRGLSSDGIMGLSPIKMSKDAIGLALATEAYGARFFSNDARPGGVLQHPGHLGDEAIRNLQNSWMRAHSGVANSSKPAVLEEGMKWEQMGMTSEDAQFIETRKYQVNEIARIFRIPPHLIGDMEKATFSNIEQQSLEFVIHTMMPWLVRWEQALNKDLILNKQRFFIKFNVDGLLRGDITNRYSAYNSAITTGWMTRNEARAKEDMNPLPGLDQPLEQLNMTPTQDRPPQESEAGSNGHKHFAGAVDGL